MLMAFFCLPNQQEVEKLELRRHNQGILEIKNLKHTVVGTNEAFYAQSEWESGVSKKWRN